MKKVLNLLAITKNLDSLIAAILGFLIIYIYTRHSGIGISPDSVYYISTARNIHSAGLPLSSNHQPLVIFPLLYPIILSSIIFITQLDPLVFAPLLNSFLFALLIYTSGWMIEKFQLRFKWYKIILLSCFVLSPCLIEIYSMLWSESVFLVLLLFFIILLSRYLGQPNFKNLLLISVIVALACVTRFIGISLIASGGLMILLSDRIPFRKKIFVAFLFGFISLIPLGINLIYNYRHSSTLTGMRLPSNSSFFLNTSYFGNVICDWLPLPGNHYVISILVTLSILLIFIMVLINRFIKKQYQPSYENISMIFFILYSLFMIITASLSRYEIFTSRLISPAYIPLLFGGGSLLMDSIKKTISVQRQLWVTIFTIFIFIGFQIYQFNQDWENYDGIKDAGIPGYTEDPWAKDSEIVNYLKANPGFFLHDHTIYSNLDDAVYFFTGRSSINLPHYLLEPEKQKYIADKKCYLVWFEDDENINLLSLKDALKMKKMTLVHQFKNGAIYMSN